MGYEKSLDYINPKYLWRFVHENIVPHHNTNYKATQTASVCHLNTMNLSRVAGHLFIKVAGFSGAAAVAMGAYGSHLFYPRQDVPNELKEVYKTANYYHFLHSLALLAMPLTKRPHLVGTLMTAGLLLFCGTCYAYALTGNKMIPKFTPYGGSLLIIAWLSMMI